MKKTLLLITEGFPYGEAEQSFIRTEFDYLNKKFKIFVWALDNNEEIVHPIAEGDYSKYQYNKKKKDIIREFLSKRYRRELRKSWEECKDIKQKYVRAKKILAFASYARTVEKDLDIFVREHKVDIIYTYWAVPVTLAAVWLKGRRPDLKVVSRLHGGDIFPEQLDWGWQPFRNEISRGCDRLFFASKDGKNYFEKRWGGNTEVAYIGAPPKRRIENTSGECLIMVSCSYLIPLKRISLIIDALAELPNDCKVIWHMIGDGEERESLEKMAKEKLSKKVNVKYQFEGWISNEKLNDFYSRIKAAVFITTSSTEGLPVSLQEAFAMGIPAIGTDVGGIPELIKNMKTGLLLKKNPLPSEIAEAIALFYRLTPEKKNQMSEYAYRLWEKTYNAERNAALFSDELYELCT